MDRNVLSFEDFQADLRASRAAENLADVFAERGVRPIDDALDVLAVFDEEDEAPAEPAENRFKNIGRNDPCPCGSGKKYKKCCLGKE